MDGNLFITTDSERSEGIPCLGVYGLLSSELFQHTGSTGETITTFTDASVDNELINLDVPHGVLLAFGRHGFYRRY